MWAKKPKSDEAVVSGITLDVMRIEACARKKRCTVASGPMQLDLLELADGKVDFANQVLLPERTRELRLVLGENNTITVDGESFPLTVPSGQTSGLKLKGRKAFGKEGGFLSGLTLDLNLRKQLVVQAKKVRHKEKGRHGKKKVSYVYSYKLKPVIKVATAEVAPLTEDNIAAVVAMPNEENEIKIGESFSLVIPAGAVATPMVISVKETKYTVEVMDEDTGEVVEKPALSSNYELSPDGAEFDEPLVVTLPYSPETLPSEVSEYDLAVYLDAEKIPTDINTMSKTATADVWHFTNVTVSSPQATGNFVFPFDNERNDVWQLCQGYNTPKISHGSATYPNLIHAFDFAYGTGNLGATGCWAKEWGKNDYASEDKTVVAPADGIIIKNSGDITVFQLKVPVSNGHGKQIKCIRLGHIKSNSARMKADPKIELAQGTLIGKLSSPTVSAGKYAHLHMAAYATTNCTGVTVPFGTVFGSGYPDFSSNGSKHQWHGTEIPAGGSQPTTCPNGDGLYCGGAVSRDMNTLYRCTDGVYSVEEQCSDGCQTMSSGTNDQCRQVQASCPSGNGLYCGGTVSRDANTLYRCTDGVYSVEEQCSDGCETMPSGTNDQCKDVVLSVVNSITPSNTTLDSLTVFTVLGTDLPSTLAFWIEECENVTYVGGNSAAQQFSCTPRWTIGTKNGVIKDNVGGNVLYNFTVNVSAATPGTCTSGPQTMVWQGLEWQRCDDNWAYTYEAAIDYCEGLILDGYSDWRLPTKDELKSLVVCSNGTPTPLADDYGTPSHCGDGNSAPYNKPTIDSSFVGQINSYWSSTEYNATAAWEVNFGSGWSHHTMPKLVQNAVRCVR
ncbi:MAG: DUF1566 domain-containing protein [Candidatus Electrothrix sp. Rat3]|nr:DUF1566 domain-containing protein [Candidatus Electrothrix rattekaaiensis]